MSDPEARKQAQELKARVGDYLKTFCTEHGKRVLRDIRKSNRYAFDPNPFAMAKKVGKQELIQEIEDMILLGKKPQLIEDLFTNPEDSGYQE